MVGTRNHPGGEFPSTPTPSSSTTSRSPAPSSTATSPSNSQTLTRARSTGKPGRPVRASTSAWTHTPSNLTLLWLAISLPVVAWDTGYILGRPATMPGGWAHKPLYSPYALYGTIDYVYGLPAYEARDGFGSAQGLMNVIESFGYAVYLYLVWAYGVQEKSKGRGAPSVQGGGGRAWAVVKDLSRARVVRGKAAAWAPLIGFAMAALTLSKTVLYGLNEACSGFKYIGHNTLSSLIFLWIIPNGMWILIPTYMTYVFGQEILEGLEHSTGTSKSKKSS